MQVQPYLSFEGRAEEAIEFYKKALRAEVEMLMRFKDAPPDACGGASTAGVENKVMHASLRIGGSTVMASDGRCTGEAKFSGISLSLNVSSDAEARKAFDALSQDGSQACVPLSKTFFASSFGIVTDRFGVNWMIVAMPDAPK